MGRFHIKGRVRAIALAVTIGSAVMLGSTPALAADPQNPQVTLSPGFGEFVAGTVTITATDVSGDLAKVELWDDAAGRMLASATSAPWTMTWDTAGRTGAVFVHLEATDRAGNVALQYGFYAVDNSAPDILRIEFPFQPDHTTVQGRVSGRSRLTADVIGPSPLERVEWWVDGTLRSTYHIPESAPGGYPAPYFDWDTGRDNRTAVLEVRAYNVLGNHGTLRQNVVIDNAGPTITSITPANRALVRGGQVWSTVAAADPSGIRQAYLHDNYDVDRAPYRVLASTGGDGARTLTWTVTDRLGNSTTARRVILVDNTRPTVKVTKAPKNGAKVKGTVTVRASAADRNGINRVELLVNGRVVAKDTRAAYTFSVKTKKYGKKIKIQVRGYDRAGNATTTASRTWRR